MVLWGAFWGAVLGLLWDGPDSGFRFFAGAVLGALAGLSFRAAVRKEFARLRQLAGVSSATPAAAAAVAAARAAADGAAAGERVATGPTELPLARPETATARAAEGPAPGDSINAPSHLLITTTATEGPTLASEAIAAPATPPPRSAAPTAPPNRLQELLTLAQAWLLGGNTVVRMGVLVLFIGLAFLAKYAVDHALLPPELRLAAIAAAGIGLFVAGVRLRLRDGREGYALTLQGAGIAVLYLVVFAAFRRYQFLPAGAAFAALALICAFSAVIAVTQNAMALAFIGFAGGYAAPVLISTGQGNHVALFGYYLVLGVAIAALAWWKAWRPLNLLGFCATFGIATVWGVLRYEPRHLASTEPFLIAFFAVFLLASLFHALRHAQPARRAVDATLVFGTPIVVMGLQAALVRHVPYAAAFSSLGLAAVYVALAAWLLKRPKGDRQVQAWLGECFAALALGFATLAVPLALDGRWTGAVWAVEGAAIYWMARRQDRWLARVAGLALQVVAAVAFLRGPAPAVDGGWPFVHPGFVGAAMLGAAALAVAWWSRPGAALPPRTGPAGLAELEATLTPMWFWIGFLWWQAAWASEIQRMVPGPNDQWVFLFDRHHQTLLRLLAWVGTAFLLHHLALPRRTNAWPLAATPAWTTMPVMLLAALWGLGHGGHPFVGAGWLAWPVAIALHGVMLRRLDAGPPAAWWRWVHAAGVWLLVLLIGQLLVDAIGQAQLWRTAWATVALLVAGSVVMLLLASPHWWNDTAATRRWPLQPFAASYLWRAAAPLAIALAAGALLVTLVSSGNARPLPYVPLLNPTDLAVALALTACLGWLQRLRASAFELPDFVRGPAPLAALAAIAFIAINTAWLRAAHHYVPVRWDASALFASFVVQAGLSILWTLLALALMVGAHRRAQRLPWTLGAALLGLTVVKLFVIDLSNREGSERIFVFIAVGLLMLVVGWFAPLPPAARPAVAAGPQEAAS